MTPSFLLTGLLVALGMALADAAWAYWAQKVAERRVLAAGLSSVAIVVINSYVVSEYVADKRFIIFAAVGAFLGTAVVTRWRKP